MNAVWCVMTSAQPSLLFSLVCPVILPQYQINHTFGVLVEGGQNLCQDLPLLSHYVEHHPENKRPDDQAQGVCSIDGVSHQSQLSRVL